MQFVAIGGEHFVLPFKAIGAKVYVVKEEKGIRELFLKVVKEETGIVLVPDNVLPSIEDILEKMVDTPLPCVVGVPTVEGSKFSKERLSFLVKKAVGVDIVKGG